MPQLLSCSQILCELPGVVHRGPNLRALYGRSWQQLIRDDMGKIPFFTLQVSCLCHSTYLVVYQDRRQKTVWMTVTPISVPGVCLPISACICLVFSLSGHAATCKSSPVTTDLSPSNVSMSYTASGDPAAASNKLLPGVTNLLSLCCMCCQFAVCTSWLQYCCCSPS